MSYFPKDSISKRSFRFPRCFPELLPGELWKATVLLFHLLHTWSTGCSTHISHLFTSTPTTSRLYFFSALSKAYLAHTSFAFWLLLERRMCNVILKDKAKPLFFTSTTMLRDFFFPWLLHPPGNVLEEGPDLKKKVVETTLIFFFHYLGYYLWEMYYSFLLLENRSIQVKLWLEK